MLNGAQAWIEHAWALETQHGLCNLEVEHGLNTAENNPMIDTYQFLQCPNSKYLSLKINQSSTATSSMPYASMLYALCSYLILSVQLILHSLSLTLCQIEMKKEWEGTAHKLRLHHLSDHLLQPNYYIWNSDSALTALTPTCSDNLQPQTPMLKYLQLQSWHFVL